MFGFFWFFAKQARIEDLLCENTTNKKRANTDTSTSTMEN